MSDSQALMAEKGIELVKEMIKEYPVEITLSDDEENMCFWIKEGAYNKTYNLNFSPLFNRNIPVINIESASSVFRLNIDGSNREDFFAYLDSEIHEYSENHEAIEEDIDDLEL